MSSFANCTQVTHQCPVEATTYGYYPVLWANATLLAGFAILCIGQMILCILTRVYSYSIVLVVAGLLEVTGYAGRIIMHGNPWSGAGFKIQIIALIIGPTFFAAGIYLTLKHLIRFYGPQYSRLRPNLYTWIFIGCDIGSILLQGIGGGVAAASSNVDVGNSIMIAGVAFQVVTMGTCGILTADFVLRRRRSLQGNQRSEGHEKTSREASRAQKFIAAVAFAYLAVLIRCIYRLPEMAGGWGNPIMQNEDAFLALDGLMILLAFIALTLFHPGFFFTSMKPHSFTKWAVEVTEAVL